MSDRYRFLNSIAPQTVTTGNVSAAIGCSEIYVTVTDDCFICVSANGTGVDGNAVSSANGHFVSGGKSLAMSCLNPAHKLGVSGATAYISAIG